MKNNTQTLSVGLKTETNRNTNNQTVGGETTINRTYWENGNPKEVETLSNGVRNGLCEIYFPNGQLEKRITYVDGMVSGLYETYYPNGYMESRGQYSNFDKIGIWEYFYPNGYIQQRSDYTWWDGEDVLCSIVLYHPNGFISDEGYESKECGFVPSKSYTSKGELEFEY
jgi:uncharacterized protein